MQAVAAPTGSLWLKMDERACRLIIEEHAESRYFASGWELSCEETFVAAGTRLTEAGVEWHRATLAEKVSRNCIDMIWFEDPSGNRHELVLGFKTDFRRFASPTATSFVTGDLGMGHTALPAPKFDATWKLMHEVLGFSLSDFMHHQPDPAGPAARIWFAHCNNGRHHSLALAEMEVASGCVHLMVEVPDMDEVGRAMDRQRKEGIKLMATLGRHVNDRMTSFYLLTPSGFALEYGYGGRVVNWDRNVVHETTQVSLWGHDFSIGFG
ncbi:MAG: VOC family protein [Proteobacteria bacterium]|nr:VOC family protein [Pseudomonadota bacterium]